MVRERDGQVTAPFTCKFFSGAPKRGSRANNNNIAVLARLPVTVLARSLLYICSEAAGGGAVFFAQHAADQKPSLAKSQR